MKKLYDFAAFIVIYFLVARVLAEGIAFGIRIGAFP